MISRINCFAKIIETTQIWQHMTSWRFGWWKSGYDWAVLFFCSFENADNNMLVKVITGLSVLHSLGQLPNAPWGPHHMVSMTGLRKQHTAPFVACRLVQPSQCSGAGHLRPGASMVGFWAAWRQRRRWVTQPQPKMPQRPENHWNGGVAGTDRSNRADTVTSGLPTPGL